MQQTQTNSRPDYARIVAALDGSALEKKLEELTHRTPPKKQKRLADVLSPYTDRLLKLHGLGWDVPATGRRTEGERPAGQCRHAARAPHEDGPRAEAQRPERRQRTDQSALPTGTCEG